MRHNINHTDNQRLCSRTEPSSERICGGEVKSIDERGSTEKKASGPCQGEPAEEQIIAHQQQPEEECQEKEWDRDGEEACRSPAKSMTHEPSKHTQSCQQHETIHRRHATESSKSVSDGDGRRCKGGKADTHTRNVGVEEMEIEATDSDRQNPDQRQRC